MSPATVADLVDDRYACLPLQADPEELISIVIVHPSGPLEALSALFEALWSCTRSWSGTTRFMPT